MDMVECSLERGLTLEEEVKVSLSQAGLRLFLLMSYNLQTLF